MNAVRTINENPEFFQAVIGRAAKLVSGGAEMNVAIEAAMKAEVEFQADMAKADTPKAKAFRKALIGDVFLTINTRQLLTSLANG